MARLPVPGSNVPRQRLIELASPLDYDEAKMFLPQFLAQQLALLKEPLRAAGAFFSYSDEGSMELPAVLQDQV